MRAFLLNEVHDLWQVLLKKDLRLLFEKRKKERRNHLPR